MPDPTTQSTRPSYVQGQRLHCEACGSEIEVITPCTCEPPDQVLQCCGKPMRPDTGKTARVGVE